jgi:hypothetical protein
MEGRAKGKAWRIGCDLTDAAEVAEEIDTLAALPGGALGVVEG